MCIAHVGPYGTHGPMPHGPSAHGHGGQTVGRSDPVSMKMDYILKRTAAQVLEQVYCLENIMVRAP